MFAKTVAESKAATRSVSQRLRAAKARLAAVGRLGISLPSGIEDGDARRSALAAKHA